MSKLLDLARRDLAADVWQRSMALANRCGLNLCGHRENDKIYAALWHECQHHLQFKHSPGRMPLLPLAEQFIAILPRPEDELYAEHLDREEARLKAKIREIEDQLEALAAERTPLASGAR